MSSTITIQQAPAGSDNWVNLATGLVTSSFTGYITIGIAFDYQVIVVDTVSGVQSVPVVQPGVLLGPNGIFGVCLSDSVNPNIKAWFGPIDTWQDASQWDSPSDALTFVPLGGSTPIISKRLQNYKTTTQRKFVVPYSGPDANGNPIYGADVIAAMYAMQASNNPILYRDILGQRFYVSILNAHDEISNYPLRMAQFDMTQVTGPIGG